MTFLSISLILFSQGVFVFSRCLGKDGQLNCCSGTVWDNLKQHCVECDPGYYGLNCTKVCQYPTYGKLCQLQCFCAIEFCDIATGCENEKVFLEQNTDRERFENELAVSKNFEQKTTDRDNDITTNRWDNVQTESSLSIKDIKQILKENRSDGWKLGFIVVSVFSTCIIIFIIPSLIHKRFCKLKRTEKSSFRRKSDASAQYDKVEFIESDLKIERVIFEGLFNAKLDHSLHENIHTLKLNIVCPNTESERNDKMSQNCESACTDDKQHLSYESNLLSSQEYVEPICLKEIDQSVRDSANQFSGEEIQLLDSEERSLYLTVTE